MSKQSAKPEPEPEQPALRGKISRRHFGRHAAAAALSLSPATVLGQTTAPPVELLGALKTNPATHTEVKSDGAPEVASDMDAKLANIVRKYGRRLSDQQRQHLRKILVYNEKMMDSIRAVALQNGDPPASVLRISFVEETPKVEQAPSELKKRN